MKDNALFIEKRYIKTGKSCFIAPSALIGHKSLRHKDKRILPVRIGSNCFILSNVVIYEGVSIGKGSIIGHNTVIREETIIAEKACIWNNAMVDYSCQIGNNVMLHYNVYIAPKTIIKDNVFLGPGVSIANVIHPGCKFLKKCMRGPFIDEGAQIGANSTINPYISIGKNAIIGSGSVVTKDIPAECFAYGNPAKIKGKIYDLNCKSGITDKPYKKHLLKK